MEEQYVSFETAKMLKEIGFEANVSSRYIKEEPDDEDWCFSDLGIRRDDYNTYLDSVTCPTQALAARWLREAHNFHVYSTYDYSVPKWFYVIQHFDNISYYEDFISDSKYSNSEEAMEAGLQRVIEIIKNKAI